jgi:hypothetical protein
MSRLVSVSLLALSMVALVGVRAQAQTLGPDAMAVKIPFTFVVGKTVMPPGKYTVRVSEMDPAIVRIISADGRRMATTGTEWAGRTVWSSRPDLKFDVYGKTRFLSRVEFPDESPRTVPLTHSEVAADLIRIASRGLNG